MERAFGDAAGRMEEGEPGMGNKGLQETGRGPSQAAQPLGPVFAFDLDRTLADAPSADRVALRRAVAELTGHELSDESVERVREGIRRYWRRRSRNSDDPSLWRAYLTPALERAHIELDDAGLLELAEHYPQYCAEAIRLYPEVPGVLGRLRRTRRILLTNGPSSLQRAKLATLGLDEAFEAVFISDEVGAAKPDPVFFEAVRRAGFDPRETVFFGDNPQNDIDGGHRAGMTVVWVNRAGHPYPAGAARPHASAPDLAAGLTQAEELGFRPA